MPVIADDPPLVCARHKVEFVKVRCWQAKNQTLQRCPACVEQAKQRIDKLRLKTRRRPGLFE